MAGDKLILTSFTAEELVDLFRPMIKDIILSVAGEKEEKLLSPAQTCLLFEPKISKTTLSTWTKQVFLSMNTALVEMCIINNRRFWRRV